MMLPLGLLSALVGPEFPPFEFEEEPRWNFLFLLRAVRGGATSPESPADMMVDVEPLLPFESTLDLDELSERRAGLE